MTTPATAPAIWDIAKKAVGALRSVTMYRATIGHVKADANQNMKTPSRKRRASRLSGTCAKERFGGTGWSAERPKICRSSNHEATLPTAATE
jgi:hypothetical protein